MQRILEFLHRLTTLDPRQFLREDEISAREMAGKAVQVCRNVP